jgi:hypothetical protein
MYEFKRIIWEEGDRIQGLFVIDNRSTFPCDEKHLSFAASVTYQIGYVVGKGSNEFSSTSIQDGMTIIIGNEKSAIRFLNKGSQGEGFRIIEIDTLQRIILKKDNDRKQYKED